MDSPEHRGVQDVHRGRVIEVTEVGGLHHRSAPAIARPEVFVAPFPQPAGRWQVLQDGGTEPRWNGNGREMTIVHRDNYLVSVAIDHSASGLQTDLPRAFFQFQGARGFWREAVSDDGSRFLFTAPLEGKPGLVGDAHHRLGKQVRGC